MLVNSDGYVSHCSSRISTRSSDISETPSHSRTIRTVGSPRWSSASVTSRSSIGDAMQPVAVQLVYGNQRVRTCVELQPQEHGDVLTVKHLALEAEELFGIPWWEQKHILSRVDQNGKRHSFIIKDIETPLFHMNVDEQCQILITRKPPENLDDKNHPCNRWLRDKQLVCKRLGAELTPLMERLALTRPRGVRSWQSFTELSDSLVSVRRQLERVSDQLSTVDLSGSGKLKRSREELMEDIGKLMRNISDCEVAVDSIHALPVRRDVNT